MATKTFHLNTEPHTANVGEHRFQFEPEVVGAEFATAYAELQALQAEVDGDSEDPKLLVKLDASIREFLATFMLPESREAFAEVKLPTRILVGMLQWVAELYGGGPGNDHTGSSSDS